MAEPSKTTRTSWKRRGTVALATAAVLPAAALGAVQAIAAVAGAAPAPQARADAVEYVRPAFQPSEWSGATAAAARPSPGSTSASSSATQTISAYVEPSAGVAIAADGEVADASNFPVSITRTRADGLETVVLTPR